jgi:hypothetical protein
MFGVLNWIGGRLTLQLGMEISYAALVAKCWIAIGRDSLRVDDEDFD